ncbi:hypothetical protein [Azospirillum sp. ST 5-10]|uniref:hypothetical protein n=1 Tax=unclassified Azospirillum TaxID=2630922 RepID=UPI003F49E1D5
MPDVRIGSSDVRGQSDSRPGGTLPEELRPAAEALVAELRGNPLLSGFSEAELFRLVCSSGYRRTLERQRIAMQSGFRTAPPDGGGRPEED